MTGIPPLRIRIAVIVIVGLACLGGAWACGVLWPVCAGECAALAALGWKRIDALSSAPKLKGDGK